MHILALDIGTSSVKAAVLDSATAAPIGSLARAAYRLDRPVAEAAEVPVERVWAALSAAARQATRNLESVEGIGLSCLTPALVLLDAADRPLAPAWTHLDRRARPAARQVWAAVGQEFLATVGSRPLPGGISAVCWRQLATDEPYLGRRVKSYLHLHGWLAFQLTGQKTFDPANASFSGLYGTLTDQQWSRHWCDYFQVEPDWLPPVVDGGTTIGSLRAAVAADLGVPAGLPVKLGTADTSCAMLAACMKPGDVLHVVGTTQVLATVTERPQPSPRRLTRRLGVGDAFVYVTHNPVGGAALEWLHQLCFHDLSDADFYTYAIAAAFERSTRVTLDPPYLGGDRLELEAHRAAFRDLTLSSDRLDLLAAVLEAMRRRHRDALADIGLSEATPRVFLTGGGADIVRRLLPGYEAAQWLDEGSLRGVARLFPSP